MPNPREPGATVSSAGKAMTPFGLWLSAQIEKRGWSDNQFAGHANTSRAAVGHWLYRELPNPRSCEGIAEALGLPLWRVYAEVGIPFRGLHGLVYDDARLEIIRMLDDLDKRQLAELVEWLTDRVDRAL